MNSIALSLVIAVTVEGIMEYLKTKNTKSLFTTPLPCCLAYCFAF